MSDVFRFIGGMAAAVAVFSAVFALGFWVTGGSIWMLAFFPLLVAAPMSVGYLVIGPLLSR